MFGSIEALANSPKIDELGKVTGTAGIQRFPDKPCLLVRFKSDPDNAAASKMSIGSISTSCPYKLSSNDDTGWIPANNLNLFYYTSPSGTAYMSWWILK